MLALVEIALNLFSLAVFYIIILSGILSIYLYLAILGSYISILVVFKILPYLVGAITDTISTILRLLREELEEASWLIRARSRIEPVKLCDEEW
jgi:hypothetical protein